MNQYLVNIDVVVEAKDAQEAERIVKQWSPVEIVHVGTEPWNKTICLASPRAEEDEDDEESSRRPPSYWDGLGGTTASW